MTPQSCAICGSEIEYIDHCEKCDENESKQADRDQQAIENYIDNVMGEI